MINEVIGNNYSEIIMSNKFRIELFLRKNFEYFINNQRHGEDDFQEVNNILHITFSDKSKVIKFYYYS